MADNENIENTGTTNSGEANGTSDSSAANGANNSNVANGAEETPSPVSPGNWRVILLGIYLLVILFAGLYGLAALMTAETLEQAKESEKKKTETVKTDLNSNSANSNKPVNSNTINTAGVNGNSNGNNNSNGNSNTNTNSVVNSAVNAAADNSNKAVNGNTAPTPEEKDKSPTTVPKNIIVTVFNSPYALTGDGYFFWVVLFAGMIGAIIRCVYSFFRHLGIGNFSLSWLWFYLMLPFGGAVLSLVLYFVIRGGFYSSSLGKDLSLNLFSFAAFGALTGLFSENAMEKLKQVAESLLTPVDPKTDKPKTK